jgi:16S rRNA G966 N2-methylase RsmD
MIVDAEFAALIPPLSAEERQQLEENIVEHGGARDPLVVWSSKGKLTVVDGHNRYEICTRLELPFDIEEMRFDHRDDAMLWMIDNQRGRRNLPAIERVRLEFRREEIYRSKTVRGRPKKQRVTEDGGVVSDDGMTVTYPKNSQNSDYLSDPNDRKIDAKIGEAAGVSRDTVVKVKKIDAAEKAGKIDAATVAKLRTGEVSINAVVQELKGQEKKAEKERIKQESIEKLSESEAESFGITHCSLTEWDAPQCQLVFTDPPYHDKHVDRFRELGQFAMQHLDEGRFLCTYTGKLRLLDCAKAVAESGLEWVWIFSVYHPFSKEKHLGGVYNIAENWRPVLVFRKPGPVWTPSFQQDVVRGERSKSHHDWSQDEQTPDQLIQSYTHPGETVLDPFCGGGTTPLVAKRVGRKCFACDVDIAAVAMATERLRGT